MEVGIKPACRFSQQPHICSDTATQRRSCGQHSTTLATLTHSECAHSFAPTPLLSSRWTTFICGVQWTRTAGPSDNYIQIGFALRPLPISDFSRGPILYPNPRGMGRDINGVCEYNTVYSWTRNTICTDNLRHGEITRWSVNLRPGSEACALRANL